ncbi:molybdopterin-dependent oxidoreductase [Pseudodesulfovibrio nedwellii]|nr:molybdopterin-dependent oxidoreductase [Pseudodesulfovibrio nedwellii]
MCKKDANQREGVSRRGFLKRSAGLMALAALGGGLPLQSPVLAAGKSAETESINGFCDGCLYKKCMSKYTVKNGVLMSSEGHPDGLYNEGNMCGRGQAQVMTLYDPWRAKTPLKRTNPKKGLNEDPGWVEISWEEALTTTAKKIGAVMEKDPREFVMLSGFGAYPSLYMRPFSAAVGTPNVMYSPGCFCSVHSASEILHGSFVEGADLNYCKFRIEIGRGGANVGSADGEVQADVRCSIDKGMRTVKVDARNSTLFSNSEWVPISPQGGLAFALSLEHVILHEIKVFDEWFVKNRTNATYLIGDYGDYVRHAQSNKPLVWDTDAQTAKEFDDASIGDYALDGSYTVNGMTARPSFALIKEKAKAYTPEWQEKITTIPAAKVRELAATLVKEARIGSTIDVNGVTMPYRPVCVSIYKGLTNHQTGHLAYYAVMTVNILLGAFDVPGGNLGFNNYHYKKDEDGHPVHFHLGPPHHVKFPPKTLDMKDLIPMQHDVGYMFTNSARDLEGHWLDYKPKVGFFYGGNLFSKGGSEEEISEGLASFEFAAAIAINMDEHTHFADIVFPEANHFETDFCYERVFERPSKQQYKQGPMGARKALVKPLYDGRAADDILIQLAKRLNILPKTNIIMSKMNKIKGVSPTTTNLKDVWDAWISGKYGAEWNFDKAAEVGQIALPPIPKEKIYQYYYAPDNQVRLPIYHIFLKKTGEEMIEMCKKAGTEHPVGNETIRNIYQPIPHWVEGPEFPHGKDGFDMNLVGWRNPQFLHDVNNSTGNPLLQEVACKSPFYGKLVLNPRTARRKGFNDGDMVYVENQYGVKVGPVPVKTSEIIHPEAAGVEGGHSRKAFSMNPVNHTSPLSWNRLIPINWKTIDPVTGAIEISPLIRITKA